MIGLWVVLALAVGGIVGAGMGLFVVWTMNPNPNDRLFQPPE